MRLIDADALIESIKEELDAIRIRRELNDLNAMLREWGYEE